MWGVVIDILVNCRIILCFNSSGSTLIDKFILQWNVPTMTLLGDEEDGMVWEVYLTETGYVVDTDRMHHC